ncbi:12492_t:CDS:2 [Entrophospora sp. SA101]|nr:12492_t:CDS:2 [Entrophospora sp. SA101]
MAATSSVCLVINFFDHLYLLADNKIEIDQEMSSSVAKRKTDDIMKIIDLSGDNDILNEVIMDDEDGSLSTSNNDNISNEEEDLIEVLSSSFNKNNKNMNPRNQENKKSDENVDKKMSTLKNNNIYNNNDELKKDGEIIPFQSQIYIGNRRYKEQSSPPFNKRVRGLSTSNGMYYDSGRTRDDQYSYYHRNDYHPVPPPYIDHHIPYGRGLLNNNNNMSRRSSNAPPPLQSGRSTIPRPSDRLRNRY